MLDELRTNRDKHELSKQVFVSLEHGIISLVYPLIFGVNFFPISRCKKIFFPKLVEIVVEPRLQIGEPRPNSDHGPEVF